MERTFFNAQTATLHTKVSENVKNKYVKEDLLCFKLPLNTFFFKCKVPPYKRPAIKMTRFARALGHPIPGKAPGGSSFGPMSVAIASSKL